MMTKADVNTLQRVLPNREIQFIDPVADELDRIRQASVRDSVIGELERNSGWLREVRTVEDIIPKRLAAVPWGARCIGCQEALERETPETEFDRSLLAA
jgi:hypothetical protein